MNFGIVYKCFIKTVSTLEGTGNYELHLKRTTYFLFVFVCEIIRTRITSIMSLCNNINKKTIYLKQLLFVVDFNMQVMTYKPYLGNSQNSIQRNNFL